MTTISISTIVTMMIVSALMLTAGTALSNRFDKADALAYLRVQDGPGHNRSRNALCNLRPHEFHLRHGPLLISLQIMRFNRRSHSKVYKYITDTAKLC